MVKAVQAEDAVSDHFDGLLKQGIAAEVGLLIGKCAVGSRDIVLAVVPHPEAGEVLSVTTRGTASATSKPKKGAGPKASSSSTAATTISLQHEDVVDHALQVYRMLPGGLSVLGVYLFAPDSGFSSVAGALCKALCTIATDAAALTGRNKGSAAGTPEQQELLLLQVDASSRKFTMKSCLASQGEHAAAASLKLCELKFGPSLASLVCLRARHSFSVTLPATDGSTQLQQLLQDLIAVEAARVMSGCAAVAGAVPISSSQPLADLLPSSSSGVSGGGGSIRDPVEVDLYCAPAASAVAAADGAAGTPVYGTCMLHGTVQAVAYVHRRDSAAKALSELKQDVMRSLTARLQMLENEAASAAYEQQQQQQAGAVDKAPGSKGAAAVAHPLLATAAAAQTTTRGLLRRVMMPWESLAGLQVCDYLMEGDTHDAAVEQARLLLGLTSLQTSQVTAAEAAAGLQHAVKGRVVSGSSRGAPSSCGTAVVAVAAAGAVAAVGMAVALLNLGQQ